MSKSETESDSEESHDTVNPDNVISLPSATARLAKSRFDGPGPWEISGVALGTDELVRDPEHGYILFTGEELEKAADTLSGQPITIDHPETDSGGIEYPPSVENTIGRIGTSGYVESPGTEESGVLYDGTLSDRDIAAKIDADVLDVSPDVIYEVGDTDPATGAKIATNIRLLQLGVVSKGKGPQNTVQLGPSRALASLSATDIQNLMSTDTTQNGQTDEARLQEDDDPAEAPDPNVGDAVRWPSEAGGEREPDEWRYGVVVDGLQDGPENSVLVAVYQPDSDYESWEARNEQNAMQYDSLIPIGSDGVGSLPPISQVRNADADPREDPEAEAEADADSESADAEADADPDNGGEDPPEGDDARPNETEQSTPVGEDEGESASETPPASDTESEHDTTTDMSAPDTAQNEPADAEAEAQADADADAEVQDTTQEQTQTQDTSEESGQTESAEEPESSAQNQDQERLKARLADLHEDVNELEQERSRLEDENARLQSQVEGAGRAYANALFDDAGPVTPDEALEMMSVEQLRQKYEERDDVSLVDDDSEPDVQGGDTSPSEGATASLSDEQSEEIQRLEEKIETAKRQGFDGGVRHYESRLADLRDGGD